MQLDDKVLEKINSIDFGKIEKRAVQVIIGFVGGYLLVHLTYKFIDDNFDFRIRGISNRKTISAPIQS